jgi:hypothetical protein
VHAAVSTGFFCLRGVLSGFKHGLLRLGLFIYNSGAGSTGNRRGSGDHEDKDRAAGRVALVNGPQKLIQDNTLDAHVTRVTGVIVRAER